MKKFLSILLAVMMVLSTVSFAAPSLAGVADTAVEAPAAAAADLAEETAAENVLKAYEFTDSTEGVAFDKGSTNTHDAANGYLKVTYENATKYNDLHTATSLSCNIAAGELKDIKFRVRFTNYSGDENYQFGFYSYFDGTLDTSTASYINVPVTEGEWVEVSLAELGPAAIAKLTAGSLTAVRFGLGGTVGSADAVVEFDYIRLIGYPTQALVLDMGTNTELADQTVNVSEKTTAAALLSMVDVSAYLGTLEPVGISDGTTVLADDALVAGYDTLTVVWKDKNVIARYEFTESTEGISYRASFGVGNNHYVDADANNNGYLRLTFDKSTKLSDIHDGGSYMPNAIIAELDDIQVRFRMTNVGADTFSFSFFSALDGGSITTATQTNLNDYPITDGGWITLSLKTALGDANWTKLTNGTKMDKFRFGFDSEVTADTIIDIDYVRFIGIPASEVNLDMGENTEIEDQTGKFTAFTTVEQLLLQVDTSNYFGTLNAVGFAKDGTPLALDSKVADAIADGGTLTVLWQETNILKGFEFDEMPASADLIVGNADTAISENGTLVASNNNGKEVYTNVPLSLPISEVDDVQVRLRFNGDAYEGGKSVLLRFYYEVDATENISGTVYKDVTVTAYDGEWMVVSLKNAFGGSLSTEMGATSSLNVMRIPQIPAAGLGNDGGASTVEIDYIRVIGFPAEPVKINMGGIVEDLEAKFTEATTIAALMATLSYPGANKITGLAATAGGAALDSTALVADEVEAGGTLYAIWDNVAVLPWTVEFTENAGYSFYAFTGDVTDGVGGHGNALQGDSGFITHNAEEGYITLNYAFSEEFKAEIDAYNAANGTELEGTIWDSTFYIDTLDGLAGDGDVIPAGAVDDIFIKIRFRDALPTKGTFYSTYKDAEVTATSSVPYFHIWNANSVNAELVPQPQNKSMSSLTALELDKWYVINVDPSDWDLDTTDLDLFRIDLPDSMPDGAKVDIDYIRFVGTGATAPTTIENVELRNLKDADYDNALRFKATVNATTDAIAANIGWVVSTEAYLNGAELTCDLYEEGSGKVKVAYQRLEGDDLVNYYDSTNDDAKVLAAFLYNIPAANALDNFVIRPFVSAGDSYAYGNAITTNLYTYAVAPYIALDGYTIEELKADGYTLADAIDGEVLSYNAEYDALDENQKAYVTEILEAILG